MTGGSKTIVVGIDPGPQKSAAVWWDGERVAHAVWTGNEYVGDYLVGAYSVGYEQPRLLAYEWVNCYGRVVGEAVFLTAFWLGRFVEACPVESIRITRPDVCRELVGDPRAKKQQVNAYLLDTYGPKGTMKKRGPLYGVAGHVWDALAVAVVAYNRLKGTER